MKSEVEKLAKQYAKDDIPKKSWIKVVPGYETEIIKAFIAGYNARAVTETYRQNAEAERLLKSRNPFA